MLLLIPCALGTGSFIETLAQDYYPLNKEETIKLGFTWIDEQVEKIPNAETCLSCGRSFKLIEKELKFYEEMKVPAPRKCYKCLHKERLDRKNKRKFYSRQCQKCGKQLQTTYASDRPEIIYCEECYNKEIY